METAVKVLEVEVFDEQDVIARVQDGDGNAFAALMDHFMPYVHSLSARIVGDTPDADDVTQEVFIRAHRSIRKFRGESRFTTWLYRITINQALRTARRNRARQEESSLDDLMDLGDERPGPLEDAMRDTEQRLLERHISMLPPRQKAVLLLRAEKNLPFAEIARIFKRTVGSVKANYFHAVQHLKATLAREGLR